MSQVTNLNVSPYFDDFDANNDYYKVLFKPGYPVQARELTTLQSILQNQIEKFGQHLFKEGAKVIPGNTTYNQLYYALELNKTYLGVPIDAYVDQLVGAKITGQNSKVSAVVNSVLLSGDSERGNVTLYVSYLNSSTSNNSTSQFFDGESVYCDINISSGLLGNNLISAGSPFAITLSSNCNSVGSSFSISEGVYFIRGYFVNVNSETLILDQYSNKPNYRVGLFVNEEIVNSDIDEALTDNSQGYNNYAAPGADRLKISTSLFKKSLFDFNDNNFIELAVIKDGVLQSSSSNPQYNLITDELARRTYAESGDYCITPFDISLKESLNDGLGNRGIFNSDQFTYSGSIPSNDLAICQISPGKAFVRGYEIETNSPVFLDVKKPRTTTRLENLAVIYNTGSTLKLNTVYGSPLIGIGNTYVLSLRDQRVGISSTTAAGKEIGVARVYDFRLESGSYNSTNPKLNRWDISLYDIQTTTEITLNEPVTLSTPKFIKGKNSGATAFLKDSVSNSKSIVLYQKSGEFIPFESFIIDGIDNTRVAVAVTSYSISDVKSVYGIVGTSKTFTANTIQSDSFYVGIASISESIGGISTVVSTNLNFPGKLIKVGNLIKYSNDLGVDPAYARVEEVGKTSITISGVTTVSGINQGGLSTSVTRVTDLTILETKLSQSTDDTLYTVLPKPLVESMDLTDSSLTIRKTYDVIISGNQLSATVSAGSNETFLPFTEERYTLINSNGTTEVLSSDKFNFIDGGKQLQIYNLQSSGSATLVTTLKKLKPKSKIKLLNKVSSILIDKSKNSGSGIGGTTLNDGLTFGNYAYGTRVQDENISINVPDIIKILAVYESKDTSNPSAPTLILSSINGPTTKTSDLLIGEKFIGQLSGSIGLYAERITDSKISYIPLNDIALKEGETITFYDSKITAIITIAESPSFNVSQNFTFNSGQKGSFYDYGVLNRKSSISEPKKKLKIYYSSAYYQSSDDGDITTVQSYQGFNYKDDIQSINSVRNSDIIDIRPRVSDYQVVENLSRSPLEFYGRNFNSSGNSSANILASDESIVTSFAYYLGRIDSVFLRKDGTFQIQFGSPSENPEKPVVLDDSLEISTITLPPYLFDASQASIKFLDHKRYRMSDIKQLEDRIKNLEYYTSLSLLESNTSNLFISDSQGLNRFKTGFFVDNFSTFNSQETLLPIENSIDVSNKELRPKHYTTSVDLIHGPVEGVSSQTDILFKAPEGINIRKTGEIITLDYSEVEFLKQSIATRTENVTPFVINFWSGKLELTPSSDTWVDTVRIDPKVTTNEGNYAQVMALATELFNVDPQTGYSPTVWGSWETNWTGKEVITTTKLREDQSRNVSRTRHRGRGYFHPVYVPRVTSVYYTNTRVFEDTYQETILTGTSTRTGTTTLVTEQFNTTSLGDKVINRDLVQYVRSRNIQFVGQNIKPLTQVYAFFDGVDVTKYCVPKLLEINMVSGVFEIGETVIGSTDYVSTDNNIQTSPSITFRVAQSNHKEGPYDNPTSSYSINPYTNQPIPSTYSSTSNCLNIDIFSLSSQYQGQYFGWVESGMTLIGQTSGAIAKITNIRLISDDYSFVSGSFYIPDPNAIINPKFETGTKVFGLINNSINNKGLASTSAETSYTSSGIIETVQEEIISTRDAVIETKEEIQTQSASSSQGSVLVSSTQISSSNAFAGRTVNCLAYVDPLAQSFVVQDSGQDTSRISGVFITRCDLFFKTKDTNNIPAWIQIRTMQNGYPSQTIVPFSEVVLSADSINTSDDGSISTSVIFNSPVYLEGGKEYAIVIGSNSSNYNVFISRVGETDLLTQSYVSNQPYLGSLFKSQNASTWEASQFEDLKFTLYRANFVSSGMVEFYNPELTPGNSQVPTLMPNSLISNSRRIRVGLSTYLNDSSLIIGNTISQQGTDGTGNYVGNAGIATGTLQVINPGIGYTPSSGSFTFTNVPLISVTGNGRDATANITIGSNGTSSGVAIAATIVNSGNGYQVGDVLGITTIGATSVGRDALLSIVSIASTNELIIDNVQGEFLTGVGYTVQYVNGSGITTTLNYSYGGNVTASGINVDSDGLHIIVTHRNHGMYFEDNFVRISGVESDIPPTRLSSAYNYNSTSSILVDDSSNFATFENVAVGATNPGYALIGSELFQYESVTTGSLNNITRIGIIDPVYFNNISQTSTSNVGTPVYKYELSGVSLQRINAVHNLNDVTESDSIGFDFYKIKIQTNVNGTNRSTSGGFPKLYLNETKSCGGFRIKATQNIPFEIIQPLVQNTTVQGTSINSEIRTITSSSISGNEIPYLDKGYESVTLNTTNYLNSPRMIASKINEDAKLDFLRGNKSLNLRVFLNTEDPKVSPVIDTQRVSAILTSNRINDEIDNFATDNRVNTIGTDPSAFQYISKEINLENPATSIKIILDAYINNYSDIRALYYISDSPNSIPIFTPFPGYNNLDENGQIINFEDSDGLSDTFIQPSSAFGFDSSSVEFREYTFTADLLPSFRYYRIKLIGTSTNQVYVPRIKNLRVIALA
jgi:hypothetical protein